MGLEEEEERFLSLLCSGGFVQSSLRHHTPQSRARCPGPSAPYPFIPLVANPRKAARSLVFHPIFFFFTSIPCCTLPLLPSVTAFPLNSCNAVTVRFHALPATPALRQPRFKISSSQRFEAVVRFLRRKLALQDHESVFCYVNSVFAPALDEGVGNLWRV